jgi:hypothetical protein
MPFPSPRYGPGAPPDQPDPRHPCPDCGEERDRTMLRRVCTTCETARCPNCNVPTRWRPVRWQPSLVTQADCPACDPIQEPE